MKVLVIIVTYNAMQWVDRCLASVRDSHVRLDAFIVDNGSTDGTQDYIKNQFPEYHFFQSNENLGFGKANNLGLQFALDNKYDYVYLLNQDAWIFPETIGKLIEIYNSSQDFGLLSPFQMNSDLVHIDKSFIVNVCNWHSNPDIFNDIYNQNISAIYPVSNVMAAHWLLPISTIKIIGGFSPSFPHYGEDDNYLKRILFKKLKIGIVPSLKVVHDRGDREEPVKKRIYMGYIRSIVALSDPYRTLLDGIMLSLNYMLVNIIKFRSLKPCFFFLKLLYLMPNLLKNKRYSINKNCPFLENR